MTASTRVDEFEELRPHLLAVAYRLTGTVADAEDIVQDAWLRWDGSDCGDHRSAGVADNGGQQAGLDRLRSAAHRRETYFGEWLPEPVVTALDGNDPLAAVVAGEDARFAAMVVLERLDARSAGGVRAARRLRGALRRDRIGARRQRCRRTPAGLACATGGVGRATSSGRRHPQRGGRRTDGCTCRRQHGSRCAPSTSGRHIHRGRQPQGADGCAGHPRSGQGGAVPVRAGPPLRAGWLSASQLAMVNGQLGSYIVGSPRATVIPR